MNNTPAFLFDLDGTMIDNMSYHHEVWYDIIANDFGADLTREEVKLHLYGKSQEVLVRIFGPQRFSSEELDTICFEKERKYQQLYKPHLELIAGLSEFLKLADSEKIQLGIGTAAMPFNVDFVLDTLNLRHYFPAIVTADDVTKSKPDPETYLKAAHLLNVQPENCIVFEDAPKGVEAARRAGMNAIVLTTMHPEEDFAAYDNILACVKDYTELSPVRVCTASRERRIHQNRTARKINV
jgi:beta-phosphoglucomutase family hydrolase